LYALIPFWRETDQADEFALQVKWAASNHLSQLLQLDRFGCMGIEDPSSLFD
jgi:hypothetical protein